MSPVGEGRRLESISALRALKGRLRYFWTLAVGGLLMLFIGIPIILIGHALRRLFGIEDFVFPGAKLACRIFLRAAGARIHVDGLENLNRDRTYLFVANHQSLLDPPLIFGYLDHNVGAIAKKELLKIPFFKLGFPLGHVVPIDRSNPARAIESMKQGAQEMRRGHSLMAFPEGTRSIDGAVNRFKKGTFLMALEAGVPVVPIAINDTRLVLRKGAEYCFPGEVYLQVLPPIETNGYTAQNVAVLIDDVRNMIVPLV